MKKYCEEINAHETLYWDEEILKAFRTWKNANLKKW